MATYGTALYGSSTYGSGGSTGGTFTSRGIVSNNNAADVWLVGEVVPLSWSVTDAGGEPADATTVTLTVEADGGTPEALAHSVPEVGQILAAYRPTSPGNYTARLTLDGDRAGAAVEHFIVSPLDPFSLTIAALREYLVDTSASDAELLDALTAERFAQAARCRVDPFTPDLLQALKRRVARNLAARRVPVATFTAFDSGQTTQRVPASDAEIRRLEGPYRRMVVG